ncbi:MAG: MerR family transcriptional regulator [Deltaproteobacteria bacterium]|nr:MerR family transcriptional regulator [Deltaproteobacteria bacterium]
MAAKASGSKRLYYKIGEACKEMDIQPYVLRYWETEFPALAPNKSRSGQRVYSENELGIIRRIKELLYVEGYTIAGAKKRLDSELADGGPLLREAQGSDEEASASEESAPLDSELDTVAVERIKTLRRGIEEALTESRQILHFLDSRTPPM